MLGMDSKLKAMLGDGVKAHLGPRVGIELEYEGAPYEIFAKKMRDWSIVQDHSLRGGGMEFVSRVLRPVEVRRALELAEKVIVDNGLFSNKRCGVHVHINCTDLTMSEVWSYITLYSLLEPHIFKEFADGREENHFCVPVMYNTHFVDCMKSSACTLHAGIVSLTKERRATHDLNTMFAELSTGKVTRAPDLDIYRSSKYSALNTQALKTFGTLEFRHKGGTTNIDEIERWVNFLIKLRKEAKTYSSSTEIIKDYEEQGVECFLEFFGLERGNMTDEEEYDIVDNAYMMAGRKPTDWTTMDWKKLSIGEV